MAARTITIEREDEGGCWTVRDGERSTDGLAWDEMLGQVVALTHRGLGAPHYAMHTQAEHDAIAERRRTRMDAMRAEDAAKQTEARALLVRLVAAHREGGAFSASFQQLLGRAAESLQP